MEPPPPPPPSAPANAQDAFTGFDTNMHPPQSEQQDQDQQQNQYQVEQQPQQHFPSEPSSSFPSSSSFPQQSHEFQSQQSAVDSILSNQSYPMSQDAATLTSISSQPSQSQPQDANPHNQSNLDSSSSNLYSLYPPVNNQNQNLMTQEQQQPQSQPIASTSQIPMDHQSHQQPQFAVPQLPSSATSQTPETPTTTGRGRGRGRGGGRPRGRGTGKVGRPRKSSDDEGSSTSTRGRRSSRPVRSAVRNRDDDGLLASSLRNSSGNAPRLKLKMRQAGEAGDQGSGFKTTPYMQGFDRELDSSDDENGLGLAFEEQLILRMPEGKENDRLKEMVRKRELGNRKGEEVELKFKDSRRATFKVGTTTFPAKLVDLPCLIESHKTLDTKHMFKIADISQMLLVEPNDPTTEDSTNNPNSEATTNGKEKKKEGFNIEDFVYPHGITPPMKWVRKRRFRKRAHKRTIETVEAEMERLIADDQEADEVQYEMIDAAQAEFSDSENGGSDSGDNRSATAGLDGASQAGDVEMDGVGTLTGKNRENQEEGDEEETGTELGEGEEGSSMFGGDSDVDEDLAAELAAALEEEEEDDEDENRSDRSGSVGALSSNGAARRRRRKNAGGSDEDDDDLWDGEPEEDDEAGDGDNDGDGSEEEEDEEEMEIRVRENQLEAECREIEALVKRKTTEAESTNNVIIKRRQQDALKRLITERDLKRAQLTDVKAERKARKDEIKAAEEKQKEEEEKEKQKEKEKEKSTSVSVSNSTSNAPTTGAAPSSDPSDPKSSTQKAPKAKPKAQAQAPQQTDATSKTSTSNTKPASKPQIQPTSTTSMGPPSHPSPSAIRTMNTSNQNQQQNQSQAFEPLSFENFNPASTASNPSFSSQEPWNSIFQNYNPNQNQQNLDQQMNFSNQGQSSTAAQPQQQQQPNEEFTFDLDAEMAELEAEGNGNDDGNQAGEGDGESEDEDEDDDLFG